MLKIKLKLNYRSSKLKVCSIIALTLFLVFALYFFLAVFSLLSKWKANRVDEVEITLNTENLLALKGSLYIKMLNGAPLPVKVNKVFCFFLANRKTNDGKTKPEVYALASTELDKVVSPGLLELRAEGNLQVLRSEFIGFILQNLISGVSNEFSLFVTTNVSVNFLGSYFSFCYSQTIFPQSVSVSPPAFYLQLMKEGKGPILNTLETDIDELNFWNVLNMVAPNFIRSLSSVYFFKVLVLFDFYPFTVSVSNLEADFVLYKIKNNETIKQNTAQGRKEFNGDLSKATWSVEFKKVIVDLIDIKPIKLKDSDIFKNRLLLILKYDPEQENKKREEEQINYETLYTLRSVKPNNEEKLMLKVNVVKTNESVNYKVDKTIARMIEEVGGLNIQLDSNTDDSNWNKKCRRFVKDSFWDE